MSADVTTFQAETNQRCWGLRALPDGRFLFQLWAPAERSVSLRLNGIVSPMIMSGGGWHRLEISADYGNAYAFILDDERVVGDPASRQQAGALDGPSILTDPNGYAWLDAAWILDGAGGYAGQVIDAPEKCIFIDWMLGQKTLQLRANFSQGDIALPPGFGDRIFPVDVTNEAHLGMATDDPLEIISCSRVSKRTGEVAW